MPTYPDPFRSARLLYRAPESPDDDPFFLSLQQDGQIHVNSNATIPRPQSKADALNYMKAIEEAFCGAVICLPAPDPQSKPVPIGVIHLKKFGEAIAHHRFTEIGIEIAEAYQNQGYGGEAISWILDWAFERAGIHRVGIRCFGYNEGARRLYERIGFKVEGIGRELLWYQNKWWDDVQLGMLDREWAEIKTQRSENKA